VGVLHAQRVPDATSSAQDTTPLYKLQAITVTAAATRPEAAQAARAVPAPVLEQTLSTSTSTWELLRQAAGLEVHQQGQGPGFASDAAVRGFSSDHSTDLALWIDGVPVNEPVNGHAEGYNDWSLLFPQSIADLEVIKGPTSPLFGNFALAGVVNVRTLQRMSGTRGWASGGSFDRLEGVLLTGFDHPDAGGVLGSRVQHDGGWRPNSAWTLGQVYGRWVRDLSAKVSIDGGAGFYAAGWDSPGFLTLDQYDARDLNEVSDPTDGGFKRRAQERISARVLVAPTLLWRSTLYATQGRWQLFLTTPPEGGEEEGSGSQTEEEDRRYGFGLTSALTWLRPGAQVTVGTQNRFDHSSYQNWLTTARTRDGAQVLVSARQMSTGLFLDAVRVFGALQLEAGGRYDLLATRSSPDGEPTSTAAKGVVSPKVGALLRLVGQVGVYGNVSRGFRQPDGVNTEPGLPFITEWAYEGGLKWQDGPNSATLSAFRMDVSDEQTFDPVSLTTTSGGASRRQGMEAEATFSPAPNVQLRTGWTYTDAKYLRFVTEDGDTLSGQRIFNTARYVGDAAVDYAPIREMLLRLSTNVVGPYTPFDEPGVVLDPYGLLHASAAVTHGDVRVQLGVRNLLDRTYPELRAGGFVSPGQPRSLYLTTRVAIQ